MPEDLAPADLGTHDHIFLGSGHDHAERRTWAVIWLCSAMMILEIAGGLAFGSIALVADGLHMSTHAGALLLAALAYSYARRHAGDPRFSFGTGKLGDLAGFTSAIVLAMIALLIGFDAAQRLLAPVPIRFAEAIPIACLGLAVNLASVWLLGGSHGHSHGHGHDHHHHHGHDHDHATDNDAGRADCRLDPGANHNQASPGHGDADHAPGHAVFGRDISGQNDNVKAPTANDHALNDHALNDRDLNDRATQLHRAAQAAAHAAPAPDAPIFTTAQGVFRLTIHEQDAPPRFRLHATIGALPESCELETLRDDGSRQHFALVRHGPFLQSRETIPEPHDFAVTLRIAGLAESFAARFEEHVHGDAGAHRDNNMRAAIVHVVADAFVSVLVIAGLLLARAFGWRWTDPLAGIAGALVIFSWSWSLVRDTGAILLDMTPDRAFAQTMRDTIETDGDRITDFHVWRLGPGHLGAILSVRTRAQRSPGYYREKLRRFRSLSHVTVEVEVES